MSLPDDFKVPASRGVHGDLRRFANRKSMLAALLAVTLTTTAVGCGGKSGSQSNGSGQPVPTSRVSSDSSTTVTPSVTPSSSGTVSAPSSLTSAPRQRGGAANWPAAQPTPPALTGAYSNNFPLTIEALYTYRDWVYSHPNPALVGNYALTNGTVYASETQKLTTLRQRDWHVEPVPTQIEWAKTTRPAVAVSSAGGKPRLLAGHKQYLGGLITIVVNEVQGEYLNAEDQVVGHHPGGGPTAYSVSLAQGTDGQWRIEDVVELHPAGGISALEHT